MKIFDLTKLAVKSIRGRWSALSILGMAVAAFCLCFAGTIFTTVQREKTQPFELILSASGKAVITDTAIADILKVPDVKDATSILQVPVTLNTGKYSAQLSLTGIDASYLNVIYAQGGIFPPDSVMPYILLNEAACKQFAEGNTYAKSMDAQTDPDSKTSVTSVTSDTTNASTNTENDADAPAIDWLNASYSIISGEKSRGIISKVCGIFSDNNAKDVGPAAYVSLSVAKELLRDSGQTIETKTVWVRITNIGCAESVSGQIATLGFDVTNSNEQMQAKWDIELKEMIYLLIISAFCLMCAALMLAANRAITLVQQKRAYKQLKWMGMRDQDISHLFMLHSLIISTLGSLIGVIVSMSLSSFLPSELKGISSYTLSIPFLVAAGSFGVCILAGVIPACFVKARQP